MKKILLCALMVIMGCCLLSSCEKEDNGILKKSDLYGTWHRYDESQLIMTINKNGTYSIDGYSGGKVSGTWLLDINSRIWIQYRNDGRNYTNIIHTLDKHNFSFTDQYGNHERWIK